MRLIPQIFPQDTYLDLDLSWQCIGTDVAVIIIDRPPANGIIFGLKKNASE